jgi:L-lactate utilization protein LutC
MTTQKFDELAAKDVVTKTSEALTANGFMPENVETGAQALARIKELVPAGASVMNGSSTTLQEIGFVDYLQSKTHGWNNLHDAVLAETDPAKQMLLRKQSVVSDYYLGSAHAVTENGEMVFASASGSQLPHLAFTSPNIILVVSTKKIVPSIPDAFQRIEEYILPLEDVNMQKKFNSHTAHAKTLILHKEIARMGRKIHVIFVNEKLGF